MITGLMSRVHNDLQEQDSLRGRHIVVAQFIAVGGSRQESRGFDDLN